MLSLSLVPVLSSRNDARSTFANFCICLEVNGADETFDNPTRAHFGLSSPCIFHNFRYLRVRSGLSSQLIVADECHLSQSSFFLVRSSVIIDAFITTARVSTLGMTGLAAYVCFFGEYSCDALCDFGSL